MLTLPPNLSKKEVVDRCARYVMAEEKKCKWKEVLELVKSNDYQSFGITRSMITGRITTIRTQPARKLAREQKVKEILTSLMHPVTHGQSHPNINNDLAERQTEATNVLALRYTKMKNEHGGKALPGGLYKQMHDEVLAAFDLQNCGFEIKLSKIIARYCKRNEPKSELKNDWKAVSLPPGTSKALRDIVEKVPKRKEIVFTVSSAVAKGRDIRGRHLKPIAKGSDSLTDGCRTLIPLQQALKSSKRYQQIRRSIELAVLQNLHLRETHKLSNDVLLCTSSSGDSSPLRQQFHVDFGETEQNKYFVIVPISERNTIYVKKRRVCQLSLSLDYALIGSPDLVHAGSDTPGERLHFKLIPKEEDEDSGEEQTYFVDDNNYPN